MRIEDSKDEREDGYTWDNIMRLRGYPEEMVQNMAKKRRAKENVSTESDGEEGDT